MTTPVVVKRSVVISGHRTSISLEDAFWKSLKEIARERGTTLSRLVETIDSSRGETDHFSGRETIFVDGEEAYELDYRGGLIIP